MAAQQHYKGVLYIMNINGFQKRLNDKYPNEHLRALVYTKMNEPATVQCCTCGNIIELVRAESFVQKKKKHVCKRCFPNKCDIMEETRDKFIEWLHHQNDYDYDESVIRAIQPLTSKTLVELTCKRCGMLDHKVVYDYMRNRGCLNCSGKKHKTTNEFKAELPPNIELLGEYIMAHENTLFRCKQCGFIWKAKPHNILNGKGCPKCNRKISKGEQKIARYFEEHNIEFVQEYPIIVEGHSLRIDFFIPLLNLGIEYNGIQHYHPVQHFGGEERLRKQQSYDALKNKYFNIKTISYEDFDNIESILDVMFNDYPDRE